MNREFILTKKQAKLIFDGLIADMKEDDILYISKVLCGNMKASDGKKKYMQVGMGVHPSLFKDNGKSVSGLVNSNVMLFVIPNKSVLNKEVIK